MRIGLTIGVSLGFACVALAQAPELESRVVVGDATIVGTDDVCTVPFDPCDVVAGAQLTVTTGGADVRVRVVRLESTRDLRAQPVVWTTLGVRRVQLETSAPTPGARALIVPAGGEHRLGILHAQRPLGRGIDYRVTLEVDGQRVVVHASESRLVEHPLPSP
jgi:hypothetical protein